jgi:hypothetical protein
MLVIRDAVSSFSGLVVIKGQVSCGEEGKREAVNAHAAEQLRSSGT